MRVHVEFMLTKPADVRQADFREFDLDRVVTTLRTADMTPRLDRVNLDLDREAASSLLRMLEETMYDARRWRQLVTNVTDTIERRRDAE